ncbi:hypothetical protein CSOJ01_12329 [Colletotrichum sojae]|uniref:Uncharacterized protein n=1 Tax=Colletotrichum sojae TaxID=2175907 RepID=A0A8H6MMR0_9PEZI|nr:hypothetical protein CSOJ01_12329 [Colletotrichum sojae]
MDPGQQVRTDMAWTWGGRPGCWLRAKRGSTPEARIRERRKAGDYDGAGAWQGIRGGPDGGREAPAGQGKDKGEGTTSDQTKPGTREERKDGENDPRRARMGREMKPLRSPQTEPSSLIKGVPGIHPSRP